MTQHAHIDEFAVDKGPVGTLEILQDKSSVLSLDNGVLSGNDASSMNISLRSVLPMVTPFGRKWYCFPNGVP